jgi:hypothetical protein
MAHNGKSIYGLITDQHGCNLGRPSNSCWKSPYRISTFAKLFTGYVEKFIYDLCKPDFNVDQYASKSHLTDNI